MATMAARKAPRARLVLVVDDEPQLLELMERVLCDAGYGVLSAPNGKRALELLLECALPPDVLVTDLRMNGLNGAELARLVSARYPGTPILVVSAEDPDRTELPWPFLRKPFAFEQLVETVDRLVTAPSPTPMPG
jgi:CheY-like chemotaxis protein